MVKDVFSRPKGRPGDGTIKATKLEAAIKSIVRDVTGDLESPLPERNKSTQATLVFILVLQLCFSFVCAKNFAESESASHFWTNTCEVSIRRGCKDINALAKVLSVLWLS